MRIGFGQVRHAVDASRVLVVGGVKVEGAWGLRGRGDGDVLLLAIAEALLGAAALGDLEDHLPADEPASEPTAAFLADVRTRVRARGLAVAQVDARVVVERAPLREHRESMRRRIAEVLGADEAAVGVKIGDAGGVGAVGRGEAGEAQAMVLLEPAGEGEA